MPHVTQHASGWVIHTHCGVGAWGPDGASAPLGLGGPGPWTLQGIRVVCGAGPQGGSWALRLGPHSLMSVQSCVVNG